MGINLPSIAHQAKQLLKLQTLTKMPVTKAEVPKGHFAVYVGETEKKRSRFVVPVTYLNQQWFQDLLSRDEEEFGFVHPMGGLTIPCKEDAFIGFMSRLNTLTDNRLQQGKLTMTV